MKTVTMTQNQEKKMADLPSFPHEFRLSEYSCSWLGSGSRNEDGEETGGFVAVRVAHTGDADQDWLESDVAAADFAAAQGLARSLIAEHEDADRHPLDTKPVA